MNSVDIVIVIILALAFISGFKRGLLQTITSLVGLVLGIYCTFHFSHFAGGFVAAAFHWSEETTRWVSFALTFLVVIFLAHLVGKIVTKVIDIVALGLLNKLLGGFFSVVQYALILSVIFMFFSTQNFSGYIISEEKKEQSMLYEPIASLAPMIIPQIIEKYKEIKESDGPAEPLEERIPEQSI